MKNEPLRRYIYPLFGVLPFRNATELRGIKPALSNNYRRDIMARIIRDKITGEFLHLSMKKNSFKIRRFQNGFTIFSQAKENEQQTNNIWNKFEDFATAPLMSVTVVQVNYL